jgi:5'-3' exonuclease
MIQSNDKGSEFSIDELRRAIDTAIGKGREDEFIFACSLIGNDFLPRSAIMSDVVAGLSAIISFLAQGGSVIEDNCLSLFQYLAQEEKFGGETLLQRLYDRSTNIDTDVFPSRIFDRVQAEENKDDSFRYHWYVKFLLYRNFDESSLNTIAKACIEYVRGLNWIFNYYTLGQDDVTWMWYYPYHHAPLFSDLARTLEAVEEGLILGGDALFTQTTPYKNEERFTCLHHLVCVMPVQSIEHVPQDLWPFYSLTSPLIPFMPLTVMINNELTEVEGQVKAILPNVDYYAVMEALSVRTFGADVISKYANTKEITIARPLRSRPPVHVPVRSSPTRGEPPLARGRGRGAPVVPTVDPSRYARRSEGMRGGGERRGGRGRG